MKAITLLISGSIVGSAQANNWPAWRGPEGTGVSTDKSLPLKWSTNENVRWHADLPGPGNSSPIVWGKRVFLTQSTDKDHRRAVMCFDRDSGKLLWQSGVTYNEEEPTQESNPYCPGHRRLMASGFTQVSVRRASSRMTSPAKKFGIATLGN